MCLLLFTVWKHISTATLVSLCQPNMRDIRTLFANDFFFQIKWKYTACVQPRQIRSIHFIFLQQLRRKFCLKKKSVFKEIFFIRWDNTALWSFLYFVIKCADCCKKYHYFSNSALHTGWFFFFLVCWTPNKEKVKPISTVQKLFQPCRRDSWCVRFSLSSAASRDRTDVHHIANTFICCVLQQSAPVETGENLLIITMSTVHSYEEATRHSGNNKLVCRRLGLLSVCSPSKSWRRRHSTSTGQAECVHLLCSLCVRLSSGSKLTVRGQGGESVHSEWVAGCTHPEGSDNMDAFMTLFPMGHFSAT